MNISNWSTVAANNNSSPPDGFPENQLPSTLNNAARELMAAIRTFYQAAAWIDLGDTPTYASTTTFTVPGDQTAFYTTNRRIRCTDATTLYGYISSSVYVASTTVTVVLDSGSLSASLTAVAVSLIDPTNYPIPSASITGKPVASGYTRISPFYCIKNSSDLTTSLSTGHNTISAPSNSSYVVIGVLAYCIGENSTTAFARSITIQGYTTSGYTTKMDSSVIAGASEPTATTGYLCITSGVIKVPVVSGNCYVDVTLTNSTNSVASYGIIGYYE